MDLIQASILGLVQGLTEYLPVSSSAHLVLVPEFLGWHFDPNEAFVFNVLVQLGTLLGVIVYFWKDLMQIAWSMLFGKPEGKIGWLVGWASIPACVFGLLFKSHFEAFFSSPKAVYAFLIGTAVTLVIAEVFSKKALSQKVTFKEATVMGFAQVLALFPGISRSGSTIAGGMLFGLDRALAARFSFLMSIPVMIGASLVTGRELLTQVDLLQKMLWPLLVGTAVASVTGYIVIYWFLNFLKSQSLLWFAVYCALLGGTGLLLN